MAPEVLEAMKLASAALTRVGVRHVVVGDLAGGANGFPQAAKVVDFLVGEEAFERPAGGLQTHAPSLVAELDEAVRQARAEED